MNQYEQFQKEQGIKPQERELDWNDAIEKDGDEFILLEPGDYNFRVESFERARFSGSDKMPACNQANLKIVIETPQGIAVIKHQLLLHTRTEWAVSAFFASIGQKKKGEKVTMNWNLVPGSIGRCKVYSEEYKGNMYNKIKSFIPKEEQSSQQQQSGYTPGRF